MAAITIHDFYKSIKKYHTNDFVPSGFRVKSLPNVTELTHTWNKRTQPIVGDYCIQDHPIKTVSYIHVQNIIP